MSQILLQAWFVYKTDEKFSTKFQQFSRSFPGVQGDYLFFQEFFRALEKISKFQEFREIICFSKSSPGPWKKISKF